MGLRESLALRPPPAELIGLFTRGPMAPVNSEVARRLLRPSGRASDPNQPVGLIAAAIRKALPEFRDWPQATLPPGFSEGRPGCFLRATRAILHPAGNGPVRSIYQLLQDSPDEQTFRAAMDGARIGDVLDLTWMAAGPLELRSVQEMLELPTAAVLPGEPIRFSPYGEPRYRCALQLQAGGISARCAQGGVLAEWPGRPPGVDAAHLRIFREPWATVQSGQVVEFERLPG